MLELKKIGKSIQEGKTRELLKDVNLKVYPGDFLVILGKSGSGKSTLLNILSGLDVDYSGDIYFKGNKVNTKKLEEFRKKNIGFIFQSFNLVPYMTVYENIELAANLNSNIKTNKEKKRQNKISARKVGNCHIRKQEYHLIIWW